MVVRELVTKLGFKVDKAKMSGFEKRMDGIKGRAMKATTSMGTFGKSLSGVIGKLDPTTIAIAGATIALTGLVKAFSAATRKYLEFEKGMKGVERVTLATAEEMEEMEEAALTAGEASIFTTGDAANAMKFLAQAGLETNEVITALPGALQLAAAAEMDLATAADISTNILTSNRLEVEELTRVNDVLAKTASKTNTDVIQLGWAFAELGNIGQMAGLEVEELSAFLGVLANNGVRGSAAGTALKNTLITLLAPTKKGSDLLAKLNIDMSKYVNETGKFRKAALPKLFGELNQAYKQGRVGVGALTRAFGKLPAKGIATFSATGQEELERLSNAFYGAAGTAEKAANIAFKGLDGAIKLFSSRMDVASVKLIKDTGFKQIFEDVVRFLSDIIPPLIETLAVILTPIGVAFNILLFPLKLIGAILGSFIKIISRFGNLIAKFVIHPFETVSYYLDSIVIAVRKFGEMLSKVERGPLLHIHNFVVDLFRIFIALFDLAFIGFEKLTGLIVDAFEWVWDAISPIMKLVIEPVKKVFAFISDTISKLADLLEMEVAQLEAPEFTEIIEERAPTRQNVFNVNAPVNVTAGGRGAAGVANAVKRAVISQFSIELQKVVIESGGL
jgi:TP901 family phage tail tape measure protein